MNKNQKIATAAAIFVVGFFFIFGGTIITIFKTGMINQPADQNQTATTSAAAINSATPQTNGGLTIQDTTVGTGDVAEAGDSVTVNYVGEFTNGQVFDSSVSRNQPFTFTLGAGQVIPGWDQGLVGMKVGGTRILIVPPELGYGANTYGPIPGNSTLVFQVQLLKVTKK